MSQTSIPSSSLEFKTRKFYIDGTDPNVAKGSTLTFEDLDKTLLFLSQSIFLNTGSLTSGIYSSSFSGSDISTIYDVGGIFDGTNINDLEGKNISTLFDEMFFPTINPTAQPAGSATTSITVSDGTGTTREIGATVSVALTTTFNKGKWRAGTLTATERDYYGDAVNYRFTSGSTIVNNGTTNNYTFSNHKVGSSNTFSTAVSYSAGQQPVNSKENNSGTINPAGTLSPSNSSFSGIYPWFYGSSSAATISTTDIVNAIESLYGISPNASASKVVAAASSNITAQFNNSTPMWCWAAHPNSYQSKNKWYQDDLNKGNIATGNAFYSPGTVTVNATNYWSNITYRIYLTSYTTQFNTGVNAYSVQFQYIP